MIKANKFDRDRVVDILYSGFEPVRIANSINFIIKQGHKRKQKLKILMEYLFDNSLMFGEVFLSDNRKACILIQYPHTKRVNLKTISWDLRLAFKCIGISNVFKVLKREAILKKHHIKEPHIHAMIMAVYHEDKGMGSGYRLIKQLFDHYKDNPLPIIIETTTLENIRLYENFGFRIFKETHGLGFPLYFLKKV